MIRQVIATLLRANRTDLVNHIVLAAGAPKGWKPPAGWETMTPKDLSKLLHWQRKEILKRQAKLKKKKTSQPATKKPTTKKPAQKKSAPSVEKQLAVPGLNRPATPIEQAAGPFIKRSKEKGVKPSIEKAMMAGFSVLEIRRATEWLFTHLYENKRPKIGDRMQAVMRAMQLESPSTMTLYRAMTVPLSYVQFRGMQRPTAMTTQKNVTSWTTDPQGIYEFYTDKGAGYMGIVISRNFSPQEIFVNLNALSFYQQSHFAKEKEVLTMPGTYDVQVEGIMIDQSEELEHLGILPPWLDGKVRRKSKPSVLKTLGTE